MTTQLIQNYKHFDYNNEFIPQYNVFNVNTIRGNVGIGTFNPISYLDITDSFKIKGNLIISGNIFYNKNYSFDNNYIYTLFHNTISKSIDIGKLSYSSSYKNISDTGWISTNDGILLNTNDDRPNSIITYKSELYTIDSSKTIDLIVHNTIFIKYISIIDSNGIVQELSNFTCNSINTTYTNGLYTLNKSITLQPNNKTTIILSCIDSNLLVNLKIQFIGTYNFEAGSFWFNNKINSNKYVNRNVGIFNNSPTEALHIEGNTFINNNLNTNSVNTNVINIKSSLNLDGILNTNYIQSTKNLFIDTNELHIGKNSTNKHLCSIGDTYITKQGHFYLNNLFTTQYNLNTLYHKNTHSSINLSSNIDFKYRFYSKFQKSSQLWNQLPADYYSILNFTDSKTIFKGNTIISSNPTNITNINNNLLYVVGNTNITDTLTSNSLQYNINNVTYNYSNTINSFKSNYLLSKSFSKFGTHTYANNINTDTLDSSFIQYKSNSKMPTHNTGLVFLHNNNFYGYNSNNLTELTSNESNSGYNINTANNSINVNKINTDFINITNCISTHLNTKNIYTNYIKLPQYNQLPYVDNSYSSSIATLHFNNLKNCFQVNDGHTFQDLAFNVFNNNSFYKIEKKYNKIKNDSQFIPIIPPHQYYKITFHNPSDTSQITLTANANPNTNTSFLLKPHNKLYTNLTDGNKYAFLTVLNAIQINSTTYKATIHFDKSLDDKNTTYIHITKIPTYTLPDTSKYYIINKLSGLDKNLFEIIEATTEPNTHKFKIIDFTLYSYDNSKTPFLLFNLNQISSTKFIANIIHNFNLPSMNILTYFSDFFNLNTTYNTIFNIKGNKLFLGTNDTYIRLKNKKIIGLDKYESYIFNTNTNNHYT